MLLLFLYINLYNLNIDFTLWNTTRQQFLVMFLESFFKRLVILTVKYSNLEIVVIEKVWFQITLHNSEEKRKYLFLLI